MRRLLPLLVGLGLLVAAGCGVPEDDDPQALTPEEVPFDLLSTPTTTTEPVEVLPPSRRANLFFVNGDGEVTAVSREVADQSAEAAIEALLATDTSGLDPGLTSNIPPETTLLDITQDDDMLTVDLSEQFGDVVGGGFRSAVAQIVFTATELEDIVSVAFRVDGERITVPDEDGAAQSAPVTRNDYDSLLA